MEFPNPSPQLRTVLNYLNAVSDQDVDQVFLYVTDDYEYHWVAPGFDALGPRVKNKEQTREFFESIKGFVKDFKVRKIAANSHSPRYLHSVGAQYIISDHVEMPGKIALQVLA
jgi:hypothetical protein